jgi:chemotaxis protein MotB
MGRKKKDQPPIINMGSPEWMTTFADMMTLLLCFFILLFAMSEIKVDHVEAIRTSIIDWLGTDPASRPVFEPVNVPGAELENSRDSSMGEMKEGGLADQQTVEEFKKQIQSLKELPPVVIATGAYLRFAKDSAKLTKKGFQHMSRVAEILRGYPTQRVEIIGHVSPEPPGKNSQYKDPIELAYYRARVVRDILVNDYNLDPKQFKVTSVGRYYPPNPARWIYKDLSSNDRVEIIVTKVPLPPVPPIETDVRYNNSGGP